MSEQVTLRLMKEQEYATFVRRNLSRYAQELLLAGETEVPEHAMAEAQGALNEVLAEGLATPHNYIMAAETGDGRTVGELWCDTTAPETVFLNDFYVYSQYRKQGWGTAMLRAVEELAESQRFARILTHVYHQNSTALKMFEKRGYAPFGGDKNGTLILRKLYFEPETAEQ